MAKKQVSGHLDQKRGLFYMILYLPDVETGKKKRRCFATGLPVKGNLTAANAMLKKARKNATKGILPPQRNKERAEKERQKTPISISFSADMLFSDYLSMWIEARRTSIEEVTYVGYKNTIDRRIAPYFAEQKVTLSELTALDIQQYYTYMKKERGNSGNTIIHHHAYIRKSLADAVKVYKLIKYNPAADIERPKKDNFVSDIYSADELSVMLDVFSGSAVELPVLLAAYYGLRRSEVLGLRWSSIDFENDRITIMHTVERVKIDGETKIIGKDRTKNKSSFRSLPLIPQVKDALMQAKSQQAKNRKACKSAYCTEYMDYICVNEMGRIIYPDTVTRRFVETLKKNGLRHIRYHDLRHSCASLLLANGISLKEIQQWLGHSSFATTANIYAHLDIGSKQSSADTISNALRFSNDQSKKEKLKSA